MSGYNRGWRGRSRRHNGGTGRGGWNGRNSSERGNMGGGSNNGGNGGGGGYDNRRHYNHGGRGGGRPYRGRGRGRGRSRGGGGGGGRSRHKTIVRFHDSSNDTLNSVVMALNRDHPGPQQIRVLKFHGSPWEGVESLTKGNFYYHNRMEKQPPVKKKPAELKDSRIIKTEYRPYTVSYARRPKIWPAKMDTIILKSNSFIVSGKILETEVLQFEVTFDPSIDSENVTFREKVVLGSNQRDKRRNYDILRREFGEFQFDNHALYAMGSSRPKGAVIFDPRKDDKRLHKSYKVTFHCIDSFRLSDPSIPIQQQEALLNIFNRKRLQKAGFSRIGRGWFRKGNTRHSGHPMTKKNQRYGGSRHSRSHGNEGYGMSSLDRNEEIIVPSNHQSCPDVKIINGFECSMRILPQIPDKQIGEHPSISSSHKKQLTVFKADLSHKLVERLTLHDKLELMRRMSSSFNEFKVRAEKELLKRHFLLRYNKRNLQISSIDWDQTEMSSFELQSGGKITYKDYLLKAYDVKSHEKELCVIKDKGGAVFLPQHISLTITSKQSDSIYEEVLNHVNPPTKDRLDRIEEFVQHINHHGLNPSIAKGADGRGHGAPPVSSKKGDKKSSGKSDKKKSFNHYSSHLDLDFEIAEDSICTPAYILKMPHIVIQGERGPTRPQPVDDFKYFACRGFLEGERQIDQWGVVYEDRSGDDHRSRPNSGDFGGGGGSHSYRNRYSRHGAGGVKTGRDYFEQFVRAWDNYCSKRRFDKERGPILRPTARPVTNLLDPSCYRGAVRRGDKLLVVILPDGIRGSEVKARFTKYVQRPEFDCPVIVQCIQQSTCTRNSACLGTFEDIMIKYGNVPYRIDPQIPNGNQFIDINDCWAIGMDVSHVSSKPSVAMFSLARDPFQGSMRCMHFKTHLNPSRKEIVAFPNIVSVMYNLFKDAYEATKNEHKRLPKAIFFFRDGVADGQLQELFTKEVVGVQRALTMFREQMRLKKWRPALEYILCNKNTIDRFGKWDERSKLVHSLNVPCAIYDHVLSDRLWDFIIYPYHKNKKADRTKGVRYIVLVDGLKLGLDKNSVKGSAIDLFQFIFGLTYMFAFSVPFPLGGTAQPAPIQYAKHYAESFSQSIFSRDTNLNDLCVNNRLTHRPHIVTDVILGKAAGTAKKNGMVKNQSAASVPGGEGMSRSQSTSIGAGGASKRNVPSSNSNLRGNQFQGPPPVIPSYTRIATNLNSAGSGGYAGSVSSLSSSINHGMACLSINHMTGPPPVNSNNHGYR